MNRNKLIDLFISNISNAIVHKILEKAIDVQEISARYNKEIANSWEIAKQYRNKINPINRELPGHDCREIKLAITNKVKVELKLRIDKGYKNIDVSLVEGFVDSALKDLRVI